MQSIVYQGQHYMLHTATVSPQPADWETNKDSYIATAVADLEALSVRAQALNDEYNIAPSSPGEIKKETVTGAMLDTIIDRIDVALDNVKKGDFVFSFVPQAATSDAKHMLGGRSPQQPTKVVDTTTTIDCVKDIAAKLNQWEAYTRKSREAPSVEPAKAPRKKDNSMPMYVETYMTKMNENIADVLAALQRANAGTKEGPEKVTSEQVLASFANFMQMLKVVSTALDKGETMVLSQGLLQKDTEGKLETERQVTDVVKELWQEFRHYFKEAKKQKAKEKAKPKAPKKPKAEKPRRLAEVVKELIAAIQALQDQNPDYVMHPAMRAAFRQLKADAVAIGQAVATGAETVVISSGEYSVLVAANRVQEVLDEHKRRLQKEQGLPADSVEGDSSKSLIAAQSLVGIIELVQSAAELTISTGLTEQDAEKLDVLEADISLVLQAVEDKDVAVTLSSGKFSPAGALKQTQAQTEAYLSSILTEIDKKITKVGEEQSAVAKARQELLQAIQRKPDRMSKLPLMRQLDKQKALGNAWAGRADKLQRARKPFATARDYLRSLQKTPVRRNAPEAEELQGPVNTPQSGGPLQTPEFF